MPALRIKDRRQCCQPASLRLLTKPEAPLHIKEIGGRKLVLCNRPLGSAVEDGTKGWNACSSAATHELSGAGRVAGHHNHLRIDLADQLNGKSQAIWSAAFQGIIQVEPGWINAGQQIHGDLPICICKITTDPDQMVVRRPLQEDRQADPQARAGCNRDA